MLLLACAVGCGGASPTREPVVKVETALAKIAPVVQIVTAEGVIFPIHQASLSPKVTAPVRSFYVNRGDRVHKGQLLAVLENRDLQAAVVSAQGSYDQAKAAYASATGSILPEEAQKAELDLEDAQVGLKAKQQLYQSEQNLYNQGAIARKQLDEADVALTAARSVYQTAEKHLENLRASAAAEQKRAAQGQLEAAHGQYEAATAELEYTELRSPIDGVVADRTIYPGDIAPSGTPVLVIMDTSKIVVRLHIPQTQAAELRVGDKATLQVHGTAEETGAKVTVLSPAVDPNSTTVEVWVEAENPKGVLRPGTPVDVAIAARTVARALVIPASALLADSSGGTSVMVIGPNSRAYSRKVQTGIEQGASAQILSGLKPGEQVIVGGAYGLPDKTKVSATAAGS